MKNINEIWGTLASHSKEVVITAILLDEKEVAVKQGENSVIDYIDRRLDEIKEKKFSNLSVTQ